MEKFLGLPVLASEHGADVDKLIIYVHWLMLALFVGWLGYFIYTIWRFRSSRNPRASYVGSTTHASSYIEGAVAFIEGVLLIGFAIPFWARAVDKFPAESESTVIRVTGRQFNWISRYPGPDGKFGRQDIKMVAADNPMGLDRSDPSAKDDIVLESSEVAVPVNKPVIIHVTSLDVIHSFKVSPLRLTQDAIPGMSIPTHFVATRTNTYQINCAQLCGNGHSGMKGTFRVLSPEAYDAWLSSKSGPAVSYE